MSQYDPLDQDSQDQVRKDRGTRERLAEQTEVEDVKWLMGSKRGRRILWRVLDRAGVFRLSFSTNSMTMAFAEGAKKEGLLVLDLIHAAAPDLYSTMLKEAKE